MRYTLFTLACCALFLTACKRELPNDALITPREEGTPAFYFFRQDQTFEAGDHVIDGDYTVTAKLTIKPGANLIFTKRGSLTFTATGSVRALGTAAQPIVFKGKEAQKGYWRAITFLSQNPNNAFEYTYFQDAGAAVAQADGTTNSIGGTFVLGLNSVNTPPLFGAVAFRNCRFERSHGTPFRFGLMGTTNVNGTKYFGKILDWKQNTITDIDDYPLTVPVSELANFDANSTYTGNKFNKIQILSAYQDTSTIRIRKAGIPFVFATPLAFEHKAIHIYAGVELEVGKAFQTYSPTYIYGTAAEPVVLRANGGSAPSYPQACFFGNAVTATHLSIKNMKLALYNYNNNPIVTRIDTFHQRFNYLTINNPQGLGVEYTKESPSFGFRRIYALDQFENIRVENCPSYPISLPIGVNIIGDVTFANNGKNAILLRGGLNPNETGRISRASVPYEVEDGLLNIRDYAELTIDAGCRFQFTRGLQSSAYGLQFDSGSRLYANGTSSQPIEFFSTTNQPNELRMTANYTTGNMDYCTFRSFGKSDGTRIGNIGLYNSSLVFSNCRFENTTACGFYLDGSPTANGSNNVMAGSGNLVCP
jgi:hypothetical protein